MTKYIILSNEQQWCYNCWKAAVDGEKVRFISTQLPLDKNSKLYNIAYRHIRFKSRSPILLPFTSIWYNRFDKYLNIDDSVNTVIIIYDWNSLTKDLKFFEYLKKKHKRLHCVYLFSNIVSITGAKFYNILDRLKTTYDLVFAFDKEDSKKYGFCHSPLIYTSSFRMPEISSSLPYDLFYLGMAKDRYNTIIEIYEIALLEGLKCNFTIVGVPVEKRKYIGEIKYEPVSYNEALQGMSESRCIVDVIQGASTGFTIKTCEALVLGRKLLTTNTNIKSVEFYHRENICVYNPNIKLKEFIDLPYKQYTSEEKTYFSPNKLFCQIENKLHLNFK